LPWVEFVHFAGDVGRVRPAMVLGDAVAWAPDAAIGGALCAMCALWPRDPPGAITTLAKRMTRTTKLDASVFWSAAFIVALLIAAQGRDASTCLAEMPLQSLSVVPGTQLDLGLTVCR
jgi:hypothetical protein